jgi:hypothetical protein
MGWLLATAWGRTAVAAGLAAVAALSLLTAILRVGGDRREAKIRKRAERAKAQTIERMNDAETGNRMSDDQRAGWLRDFHDRNRRP